MEVHDNLLGTEQLENDIYGVNGKDQVDQDGESRGLGIEDRDHGNGCHHRHKYRAAQGGNEHQVNLLPHQMDAADGAADGEQGRHHQGIQHGEDREIDELCQDDLWPGHAQANGDLHGLGVEIVCEDILDLHKPQNNGCDLKEGGTGGDEIDAVVALGNGLVQLEAQSGDIKQDQEHPAGNPAENTVQVRMNIIKHFSLLQPY